VPLWNTADYSASKYGVRGLWKSLTREKYVLSEDVMFRTNLIAPTYIRTDMTASFVARLEEAGMEVGEVGDAVEGVLRVVCDEEVYGRALAICKGEKRAGDRNFDLGDDWAGGDGGTEIVKAMREGALKNMQFRCLSPQMEQKMAWRSHQVADDECFAPMD
jgi:5'-hydroxyaverantin dehydrogenase